MYSLEFIRHVDGNNTIMCTSDDIDILKHIANKFVERRKQLFKVEELEKDEQWKIHTPDICNVTPDDCGVLTIFDNSVWE